jgi:GrpB-like predicted nucleotidyltransferase (UPF0157 family)
MQAYGLLKAQLADRYGTDREGYTEAKTEFIMDVMQKAQLWDRQGRPVVF